MSEHGDAGRTLALQIACCLREVPNLVDLPMTLIDRIQ